MSAHALIVEPFETLGFMRAALVACLALALANGAVGTLLVLRRMSFDGDVLGHAVMPGAAVGFLYAGPSPAWLSLGGLASGLAVAALAGLITGGRARQDAGSWRSIWSPSRSASFWWRGGAAMSMSCACCSARCLRSTSGRSCRLPL